MQEDKVASFVFERFCFKTDARRRDSDQRKVYDEVFDHRTLLALYKLMTEGTIRTIDYPVSTGKEGNVFRATTGDGGNVAVKIYRINNATFHNLLPYIEGDPRFSGFRGNKQKMVKAWAAKEYRNLTRMRDVGMSVPEPVRLLDSIVVMGFLGEGGVPYSLLKDSVLVDASAVMDAIVDQYALGYRDAGLVHGDLSEYNVMMDRDTPHLIDVGQATLVRHPYARELLARDRDNLARFFRKKGVRADEMDLLRRMKGEA